LDTYRSELASLEVKQHMVLLLQQPRCQLLYQLLCCAVLLLL
jgi:hypothetical protein